MTARCCCTSLRPQSECYWCSTYRVCALCPWRTSALTAWSRKTRPMRRSRRALGLNLALTVVWVACMLALVVPVLVLACIVRLALPTRRDS